MRKDFDIGGKYVVLSVSTNIQSPAVIVTVKRAIECLILIQYPLRSLSKVCVVLNIS